MSWPSLKRVDPRTKLIIALSVSTGCIVTKDPLLMMKMLLSALPFLALCRAPVKRGLIWFKRLMIPLAFMILIQSLFRQGGEVILSLKGVPLVTDSGLFFTAVVMARFFCLCVVSTLLLTLDAMETLAALRKMGVPYEITFMVQTALRFLPLMGEEVAKAVQVVELKGVDFKRVPLSEAPDVLAAIFTPVIIGLVRRAESLALAMEMRGFRINDKRTFMKDAVFSRADYLLTAAFTALLAVMIFTS